MEKLSEFKGDKLSFWEMSRCNGGGESKCIYAESTSAYGAEDIYTRTTYDNGFTVEACHGGCEL